jgi:uncharacterized RDD family membrane protein YckC
MTNTLWFYINAQQEKVGPVPASVVAQAYARGQMRLDSLVWAEHLPQWQALSDHAQALGINLKPLETTQLASGEEVKYAHFIHRWAAHLFDTWLINICALLIIGSLVLIAYLATGYSFSEKPDEAFGIGMMIAMFSFFLVYPVLSGTYHSLLEGSKKQGSLGKQFLGIIVTTDKGAPVDRSKAFIRWASSFVSHMTQSIGFIIAAFTPRRQALHDYMAGTLVLEGPQATRSGIERNTRAIWCLAVCLFVLPTLLVMAIIFPIMRFAAAEGLKKANEYQAVDNAIAPVKQLVRAQYEIDQTCLTDTDAAVAAAIAPLKPKVTEIIIGDSEDESGCEIYATYGDGRYIWYRMDGGGPWYLETETATGMDE